MSRKHTIPRVIVCCRFIFLLNPVMTPFIKTYYSTRDLCVATMLPIQNSTLARNYANVATVAVFFSRWEH